MLINQRLQHKWFTCGLTEPIQRFFIEYYHRFAQRLQKAVVLSIVIIVVSFCRCGIYTFNGSTLPSHIKTLDIPLFLNNSLEPGIADEITQDLSKKILSDNQLRVISNRGDATIRGGVTSYSNEPYSFGTTEEQKVDVEQYIVKINATIDFVDNKKDNSIFKGSVTGEGIYDFKRENETTGRERAKQEVVRKILEKSIQSW